MVSSCRTAFFFCYNTYPPHSVRVQKKSIFKCNFADGQCSMISTGWRAGFWTPASTKTRSGPLLGPFFFLAAMAPFGCLVVRNFDAGPTRDPKFELSISWCGPTFLWQKKIREERKFENTMYKKKRLVDPPKNGKLFEAWFYTKIGFSRGEGSNMLGLPRFGTVFFHHFSTRL